MLEANRRVAADHVVDGRWANPDGSVLDIEVHEDGRVTGTFTLGSDRPSYRPYRVTGTYLVRAEGGRGVVGSVVGWPRPASVTVWTGEYDADNDELRTSWLSTALPGDGGDQPPSVGGAVFRRLPRSRSMARAG